MPAGERRACLCRAGQVASPVRTRSGDRFRGRRIYPDREHPMHLLTTSAIRIVPRSPDQAHACLRCALVERCRVFASVRSGDAIDQAVREIGLARLEKPHGLPDGLGVLDDKLLRAQDSLQYRDDLALGGAIAFFKNPYQLGQSHRGYEAWSSLAAFRFDQVDRLGRLLRVVLGDIPDEKVGIEPDHRPEPRRLIAAFMASTETGFRGRRTMPLSARTSSVAGLSANSPEASSTNSTRSPVPRPSFSRTATGMVICPLLVN